MLESLGLDEQTESVYRAMLDHPDEDLVQLAVRLDCPGEQIRRNLEQLSSLALVQPAEDQRVGYLAVGPETAMELLLARQQADLAAQQLKMAASRVEAARLIAEYSAQNLRHAESESELIEGPAAIRERIAALGRSVEHEVMTFAPGGAHPEADLKASRGPNEELLKRGVRIRTVYLNSIRAHQPTVDHVNWLTKQGGQVRTAATLPVRLIIMDRRRAVLPVDTADARVGAIVVSGKGNLVALCALFESIWESATPLGAFPRRDPRGLPAQEAEVLRLLAQGLTDDSIAKRLGVSSRTARRISADLMTRLDASSRFEAGVHAVQDGWLPLSR